MDGSLQDHFSESSNRCAACSISTDSPLATACASPSRVAGLCPGDRRASAGRDAERRRRRHRRHRAAPQRESAGHPAVGRDRQRRDAWRRSARAAPTFAACPAACRASTSKARSAAPSRASTSAASATPTSTSTRRSRSAWSMTTSSSKTRSSRASRRSTSTASKCCAGRRARCSAATRRPASSSSTPSSPGSGQNYGRISYGTYSTINAEGAVGGELSDGVAVRLSGLWQHRNDWIDNLNEPGEQRPRRL